MFGTFSALIAKRIAEKKEKVAAIKASHKKCVYLYLNISSAAKLMFQSQDCISAGSCLSGFALYCTFLMQFRVVWCYILMPCHFYVSYSPDSILYE